MFLYPIPVTASSALLILPGLGDSARGRRAMRRWGAEQGFDVHIPRYRRRGGMGATLDAFAEYVDAHGLAERQLVAFCYVVGGWTLNAYLKTNPLPNLTHIVYDRSPYQERVARAVVDRVPLLGWLRYGTLLREFAATPYPPIAHDRKIGLLIERGVTRLARWFVTEPDLSMEPDTFGQPHDDATHVDLDHDAMYTRYDVIGLKLAHFFEHGRFATVPA